MKENWHLREFIKDFLQRVKVSTSSEYKEGRQSLKNKGGYFEKPFMSQWCDKRFKNVFLRGQNNTLFAFFGGLFRKEGVVLEDKVYFDDPPYN